MPLLSATRRLPTLALAAALVLAACSDDSNDPSDHGGIRVAVLTDTSLVQYDPEDIDAEGSNMIHTLEDEGYDVFTVSALQRDSIIAALATADVFVIPEQEEGDILDYFEGTGIDTLLGNWVAGGGVLVSAFQWHHLNAIFGWEIDYGPGVEGLPFVAGDRLTGTPYAGMPNELEVADATDWIDVASLPAGAIAPWRNDSSEALLFAAPEGSGWVVWLGYDWWDAKPFGTQDGGWVEALARVDRFE
jgi:hypothetical protein